MECFLMIRKFISYYKPHWKLFAADLFCALMIAAVDLLFPIASRYAMQNLLPHNAYGAFFGVMGRLPEGQRADRRHQR